MSGICGLFHPDGAPVDETTLAAMTVALQRRGPDGTGKWHDGAIGLGHTLLTTTTELRREPQPLRHAETGCVVVADVRLDYRAELLEALHLSGQEPAGDAGLILHAYLRWGEDCTLHLFGDFAFALWDTRNNTLFCARDRFGARPFYYHFAPRERFVLASDARAILTVPKVPFALNEGRIADFIVPELEWIDYTSTFYEGVLRLPPAHQLTISASGLRIAEYWTPSPASVLQFRSDEDYCEGFLEVFSRAVEQRLKAPSGQAGSMLSGGMDSGSVTAIAHGLLAGRGDGPLPVYSLAQRRGAECEESKRLYATLDHLGIPGKQVFADEADSLIEQLGTDLGEPFDGQFLFLRAIYENARRNGVNVVLDGAAGDLVFNEGAYIQRLLRTRDFKRAWREIVGEQAFWGSSSPKREFARYLASAFIPEIVKRLLRGPRQRRQVREYVNASLISPEFARRIDIETRFERMGETFAGLQSDDAGLERTRKIRPNLTAGRERYARIAAAAGVEGRDPFTDQRVVEFCARLPDHVMARNGWPKFLLRQAMATKLPEEVRWGRGKPHIGSLYNRTFLKQEVSLGKLSPETLANSLEAYVDVAKLRSAWRVFESGGNFGPVHSAHILSCWLEKSVKRPVVIDKGFG